MASTTKTLKTEEIAYFVQVTIKWKSEKQQYMLLIKLINYYWSHTN